MYIYIYIYTFGVSGNIKRRGLMDFIPTSKHAILLLFFFFIEMVPVNTCISIENKLCSTAWLLLVSISVYVSVYKHTWSH